MLAVVDTADWVCSSEFVPAPSQAETEQMTDQSDFSIFQRVPAIYCTKDLRRTRKSRRTDFRVTKRSTGHIIDGDPGIQTDDIYTLPQAVHERRIQHDFICQ